MKAEFLSQLVVMVLNDSMNELVTPFSVRIDDQVVTVDGGFRTDFASVPRIPFAYWLAGGCARRAAVVHDWLYTEGKYPRAWCDDVFAALCRAAGDVPAWRRGLMWAGVRIFGASHYGQEAPA